MVDTQTKPSHLKLVGSETNDDNNHHPLRGGGGGGDEFDGAGQLVSRVEAIEKKHDRLLWAGIGAVVFLLAVITGGYFKIESKIESASTKIDQVNESVTDIRIGIAKIETLMQVQNDSPSKSTASKP